ncbi:hypothetical protein ACLSZP_03610 [Avibacterium avium]|uniref:hypothetical protein n=1 Tax=Avibacterium avium TaxID=751 RepID=UPI003BF8BA80
MDKLKFADVTLVNGGRAWINFHEIECIKDCYYRFDEETDDIIEGDKWEFKATKVIMKSGRIYYIDFTLNSFDNKFNLDQFRL